MSDTLEALEQTCPAATLEERAAGLSRAAIMKSILSEQLSQMLAPIYAPLTAEEFAGFDLSMGTLPEFYGDGSYWRVWANRLLEITYRRTARIAPPTELLDLNDRHRVFFSDVLSETLQEGARSGVIVPLTTAIQIEGVESDTNKNEASTSWPIHRDRKVLPQPLIEIMSRPGFDSILLHLTKGPNGFLGPRSNATNSLFGKYFYEFYEDPQASPYCDTKGMHVTDAYATEDGKVVRLSKEYYLAAERKRQDIRNQARKHFGIYHPHDSSGCPMRHRQADIDGNLSEPMIVAAKKFVMGALQATHDPVTVSPLT